MSFEFRFLRVFRIFKKLVQDYKKNNKIHIHLLFLKFLSVIRYFQFTVPDNNLILHLTFSTQKRKRGNNTLCSEMQQLLMPNLKGKN